MFSIDIDADRVLTALDRLSKSATKMAPAMRIIAGIMEDAVAQNFLEEGRPKWMGLKPASWLARAGSLNKKGEVSRARFERNVRDGKILRRSSILANSIQQQSDANSAIVGTNLRYAAIHQFGGRTSPHEIRPRHKKALAWAMGRHPVKSVQHPGSVIPARPFLSLTPSDEDRIVGVVSNYLRSAVE